MDPLTAIGLVSNILSFIDFSARLLKGAKEVHDSHHGVLEENRNREAVMREMQRLSTQMLVSRLPTAEKAGDDSTLCILASECHQLSTQLISLLEKIKPDDSGSKAQSLLSAIRNKVYDSERESLEARLCDCRAQLHLELSNLTRTETLKKLDDLIQASKTDEARLHRIEVQITQLRENITSNLPTSEVTPMLRTLLAEEDKVFTTIARDRILDSLSFEGMSRRSNMVVETHANTYKWVLEDDSETMESSTEDEESAVQKESAIAPASEDIEKVRARDKLRAWLESKTSGDVFHLSGKLGSGKSTLMKHIRGSPRTEEKLKKWADGRKLTIANFYFWNIGSDYEKSLQGLYTSLLHQIFSQCPDIIPQIWPAQWAYAYSAPWLVPRKVEVTKRDVMQAFERVIKSDDALKNHCFAFFIDGLDEFQSTVQDDHRDLVRLLCQWAASESGNIKICVSSREYPVFMDGFTATLRIRFHDLTRHDMDTYIRDKLAHASAEGTFESLVSLIMEKADGVFLWVALVVKSLREGLENGQSCSDLTREVDILPDQLESLYRHILASLGKSARRKAYQTFAMVTELKKQNYRMSLLAYSFFEEYETAETFFMKDHNAFPIDRVTGDRGKERAQSTIRKLAGWCKGLVEPYEKPIWNSESVNGNLQEEEGKNVSPCIAAWRDWSMELDFVHRSVAEFLESDDVQRDMELNLSRFDSVDAVLSLIPSDVLFESSKSVYNTSRSGSTSVVLVQISEDHGLNREPYTYLRRVRELLAATKPKDQMTSKSEVFVPLRRVDGLFACSYMIDFLGESTNTSAGASEPSDTRTVTRPHYFWDPLHILTHAGLTDYPLWNIANNPAQAEQPETISSLACLCLDEGYRWGGMDGFEPLAVLEALFKRGWVSPESITNYRLTRYGCLSEDSGDQYNLTLWQRFLIKMLNARYWQYSEATMRPEFRKYFFEMRPRYDGKLLQLFLQFKEDTEFSFEIRKDEDTPLNTRDFVLHFGRDRSVMKLRSAPYTQEDADKVHRPWEESEIGLPSQDGLSSRRHISFKEFLEHSWFDNKAELLEMLDEKSRTNSHHGQTSLAKPAHATAKEGYTDEEVQGGSSMGPAKNASGQLELSLTKGLELRDCLGIASRWARCALRNEYFRYAAAVLTGIILTVLFSSVRQRLTILPLD